MRWVAFFESVCRRSCSVVRCQPSFFYLLTVRASALCKSDRLLLTVAFMMSIDYYNAQFNRFATIPTLALTAYQCVLDVQPGSAGGRRGQER